MKTGLFLLLFILILLYPKLSLYYASTGLSLWLECMVPALLPFMILSAVMVRQNLTESFVRLLYPVFAPFKISRNCVYCIVLGFLCGFPMGARTIAELYERKQLTKKEASFLLAFCNNIGPVYFISFFLPTIGMTSPYQMVFLLFGMYGIPLCYGIFLRFTGFLLPKEGNFIPQKRAYEEPEPILKSLDAAMESAILGITVLGGYMVLFNLLNLLPHAFTLLFQCNLPDTILPAINCMVEITGGLNRLGSTAPYFALVLLPLGGLSCIVQTGSCIKNTDLTLSNYFLHKSVQTVLAAGYYFLCFRFLF